MLQNTSRIKIPFYSITLNMQPTNELEHCWHVHFRSCTCRSTNAHTHTVSASCKTFKYHLWCLQFRIGARCWAERNRDCSLQTCKPPQFALSRNTQALVLTHTKHTLQETMAKLWEDSLFEKQEVVTSCIQLEYTSVILTQPAISDCLKTLKWNREKEFPHK